MKSQYPVIMILVVILGVGTLVFISEILDLTQENIPSDVDKSSYIQRQIRVGRQSLVVDLADTPAKRQLGLSGRASLERGYGMLFAFDRPEVPGFWMKDMHFPIDIIWIDENGRIIEIHESVRPDTYPQAFRSHSPVLYVIEVPAGWSAEHGIRAGVSVTGLQ